MELHKKLKKKIRVVNNWPVRGVAFQDLNPVISDRDLFLPIVGRLAYEIRLIASDPELRSYTQIKVAGIEARGFTWGAAVAYELGSSFVPIRKMDKIPPSTVNGYTHVRSEYSETDLVLPSSCIKKGEYVVLIDDVLATGQTALGAINLLKWAGANVLGAMFVLRIKKLSGEQAFQDIRHFSLLDV